MQQVEHINFILFYYFYCYLLLFPYFSFIIGLFLVSILLSNVAMNFVITRVRQLYCTFALAIALVTVLIIVQKRAPTRLLHTRFCYISP